MEQVNIFTGGINRDINPHLYKAGEYYYLENGDILTDAELNTASVVSVLGNSELDIEWPADVNIENDPYDKDAKDPYGVACFINGVIYSREDIVL